MNETYKRSENCVRCGKPNKEFVSVRENEDGNLIDGQGELSVCSNEKCCLYIDMSKVVNWKPKK